MSDNGYLCFIIINTIGWSHGLIPDDHVSHKVLRLSENRGYWLRIAILIPKWSGWWFEPLWKIGKSIGMIIPNIWEKNVPNHQPVLIIFQLRNDGPWGFQSMSARTNCQLWQRQSVSHRVCFRGGGRFWHAKPIKTVQNIARPIPILLIHQMHENTQDISWKKKKESIIV